MRKNAFIISFIAISFLTSCGGNGGGKNEFKASVNVTTGETVELSNSVVDASIDYSTTISFSDETYHSKKMPDNVNVTSNGKTIDHTYTVDSSNTNVATLTIDKSLLNGDIEITFGLIDKEKWYEFSDWWNYCSTKKDNVQIADINDDLGRELPVKINNLVHKVRLIDCDKDVISDENEKFAHCTFEFKNLITVSNGKALTHIWDETNNYEYGKSSIHYFLNGSGDSVINMLPISLQNAIKLVTKKVGTSSDGINYSAQPFTAKLFLLACSEVNSERGTSVDGEGDLYKYYSVHTEASELNKKAVAGRSDMMYWFRSPWYDQHQFGTLANVWATGCYNGHRVDDAKDPIAPAFCI